MTLRNGLIAAAVLVLLGAAVTPQLLRWRSAKKIAAGPGLDECGRPLERAKSGLNAFPDVTQQVALDFHRAVGPPGTYYMPEFSGSGGALFDYDNDGDLDIYLVNSGRSPASRGDFPAGVSVENRLYRQESNGSFTDVTAKSGLGDMGYGGGCAIADVDNDGDLDVYLTHYTADRLYLNNGDETFHVAQDSGLNNPNWGTGAVFFDYDRDGWLDLFVVNYLNIPFEQVACGISPDKAHYCGPMSFPAVADRLYHNEGVHKDANGNAKIRFREVSKKAGIARTPGAGFAALAADFSGDGWPDLYVANDAHENRLWVNQRNGTFVDEAVARGVATDGNGVAQAGMGLATGDIDGDGDFDVISTHLVDDTSTMYVDEGEGYFSDASKATGVSQATYPHTGWGVGMLDLDHDGDLDLALANGLVIPCDLIRFGSHTFQFVNTPPGDLDEHWKQYADDCQLLMNDGKGAFTDFSASGGDFCRLQASARALIHGDIDNDGDLDLLVTYLNGPARLFRNELRKSGNWLTVRAVDPRLNREAYGAVVHVDTPAARITRILNPSSSYLGSNDSRLHYGVGPADAFKRIVVEWPDGLSEVFPGGATSQFIELRRGEGEPSDVSRNREGTTHE